MRKTTGRRTTTKINLNIVLLLRYACNKNIPMNEINEQERINPTISFVRFILYVKKNSRKKKSGIAYHTKKFAPINYSHLVSLYVNN